jgi:hypothetical protein
MKPRTPHLLRLLALGALALPLLGAPCTPQENTASLWLDPPISTMPRGAVFTVDVVADVTKGTLQAFELGVAVDVAHLAVLNVFPHEDFDDDSQLFVLIDLDLFSGTADRIVDLRHGESIPIGQVRLATLQVLAHTAGTGAISLTTRKLAAESGADLGISALAASVEVTP